MALTTPRPCTMIDSLTTAQEARFPEFVERWTRIGLCTEPANHAEAERGIVLAYQQAKLPPPRVVWCGSPLSMALTRSFILQCLASVGDSVGASVGASGYGQHDASWLAFYAFFREVIGLEKQTRALEGIRLIAENAGWWLPQEKICWISERHTVVKQTTRHRLHCEDGPAVLYPDGFAIHAYQGVRVPAWIIEQPQDITPAKIEGEANAEIRRVMLLKFGLERYLRATNATPVDHDRDLHGQRILYELRDPLGLMKVVELENSTREADGSRRKYTFRVPPQTRTCQEAVAWLYATNPAAYAPVAES